MGILAVALVDRCHHSLCTQPTEFCRYAFFFQREMRLACGLVRMCSAKNLLAVASCRHIGQKNINFSWLHFLNPQYAIVYPLTVAGAQVFSWKFVQRLRMSDFEFWCALAPKWAWQVVT